MQRIIYGLLGLILVLGLANSSELPSHAPSPSIAATIDIDAPSPLEHVDSQGVSYGLVAKVLSQKISPLINTSWSWRHKTPLSFWLHTFENKVRVHTTFKSYILFRAILI
ncbi:hypothetical protein QWY31_12845 [Cytophagales bacterium LB-30]|uniref:Uncharacterized protein n=1 Tax=Shiella aurantiaca TaxID=3058365 RepID=A0ABT8F842_9BACT|nr:hypothetical protein [Shiella aurantiaca]MDN4166391.1 hypothetical protein [Shiella aurantiaca]